MMRYLLSVLIVGMSMTNTMQGTEKSKLAGAASKYNLLASYARCYEPDRLVSIECEVDCGCTVAIPVAVGWNSAAPKIYDLVRVQAEGATLQVNDFLRSMVARGEVAIALERIKDGPCRFVVNPTEKMPYNLDDQATRKLLQTILGSVVVRSGEEKKSGQSD